MAAEALKRAAGLTRTVDEEAAALVGIDVGLRIVQVREFGERGAQEMLARFHFRPGYDLAP